MDERPCDVFLRIRHPDLDPDEITRDLGLVPEHCWRAGDVRPATDDGSTRNRYAESYWIAQVSFSSLREKRTQLEGLLVLAAALLKSRRSLWEQIRSGVGSADLLVTLYAGTSTSVDLPSQTLSLLDGIGLSFSVEARQQASVA